jgi:hypothetical protein
MSKRLERMRIGRNEIESMLARARRFATVDVLESTKVGWVTFAAMAVAAAAWLFHQGHGLTFFWDEWGPVLDSRSSLDSVFQPHNGHIVVFLTLAYKAFLPLFGITDYSAYRRRIGPIAALAPAAILLFLGVAAEDLLWGFQIGFIASIATGLAALMLIERSSIKSGLFACFLLVLSVGFSEIGLSFLIAILFVLIADRSRWNRIWIGAIPTGLYGLWYAQYDRGQTEITFSNVIHAPSYIAGEIEGASTGIFGLGGGWSEIFSVVIVYFVVKRLVTKSEKNRLLWALVLGLGAFWLPVALIRGSEASPASSRYIYVGGAIMMLIVLELMSGWKVEMRGMIILGLATAAIVVANIPPLYSFRDFLRSSTQYTRAELGAMEIARGTVASSFMIQDPGNHVPPIVARDYFRVIEKYGSPAYAPSEISSSPEPVRQAADRVLTGAGLLSAKPEKNSFSASSCERISPSNAKNGYTEDLPSDGLLVRASSRSAHVTVRRFALTGGIDVGTVQPSKDSRVTAAADRAGLPWRITVKSAAGFTLCGS